MSLEPDLQTAVNGISNLRITTDQVILWIQLLKMSISPYCIF